MTDWFRSWHGAPTDPKWLGIARKANVAPGIAAAVAWALMDRASQADDRGSIDGYDADGLACFFGCDPEQVDAIVEAMTDKGMISSGRFSAWEKRQPKREDSSSERVRAHRERTKAQTKRDVTQCNAPDTDTDTDTDTELSDASHPQRARADDFEAFWSRYPNKVGKAAARQSFLRAVQRASLDTIMVGLARYCAKTDDRAWCNPATWLNQDRWDDQPAPPPARGSPAARSGGLGAMFGQMGDYLDGQENGDRDYQDAGKTVLSLPYRSAGR